MARKYGRFGQGRVAYEAARKAEIRQEVSDLIQEARTAMKEGRLWRSWEATLDALDRLTERLV